MALRMGALFFIAITSVAWPVVVFAVLPTAASVYGVWWGFNKIFEYLDDMDKNK